jgi:hypothetical protein
MRMQLEVELEDGNKLDVTINMADMVRFESNFNISIAKLGQEMMISHLLWLAWSSLTRQKQITSDFDTWVNDVAMVGAADPKASKG